MKRTILVVDDDLPWLRITGELFEAYKHKAYTAATCEQAVALLAKRKVDCVLLDFHLTDGKAGDVALFMQADEKFKKVPIIVISGDEQVEAISYQKCKADGFILKGAQFETVLAAVESAIAARRVKRPS